MARTVAIGQQDFGTVREKGYFYIDKTRFIKEWWESGDSVTLINRPRRFGKTLTMSMVEKFFSISHAGRADLFEGTEIWEYGEYREQQGTYPVIFLSFADVKETNFQDARKKIGYIIEQLYSQHDFLLEGDLLNEKEKRFFRNVTAEMENYVFSASLKTLSNYLYRYYGKKVIILLDEYDTPMQEAYVNGYWDELADFMRKLFNSTFKTNLYLERGILTGITRVSRESVFSDLNSLAVVTTTSGMYESSFGFTQKEVVHALADFSLQDKAMDVKRWYDGFRFGRCDHIYNPWSVIHYLKYREFAAYWANTSSNRLVADLIQQAGPGIKAAMENLLGSKPLRVIIDEQVVFSQLDENENAIWSLLLACGYLKASEYHLNEKGRKEYVLEIVNFEVYTMFEDMFRNWFASCITAYNDFVRALLSNDVQMMTAYISRVTASVISHFDSGRKPSGKTEPERFFHGLVLGLMADLNDKYMITSNRESGLGRYDVLLEPRGSMDDGIIFEFKVFDPDGESELSDTADAAVKQIIDKNYAAVLEAKHVPKDKIRVYGFAFEGKRVLIHGGYLQELEKQ